MLVGWYVPKTNHSFCWSNSRFSISFQSVALCGKKIVWKPWMIKSTANTLGNWLFKRSSGHSRLGSCKKKMLGCPCRLNARRSSPENIGKKPPRGGQKPWKTEEKMERELWPWWMNISWRNRCFHLYRRIRRKRVCMKRLIYSKIIDEPVFWSIHNNNQKKIHNK